MVFNIHILGSNSAVPTLKRHPTAQLVNHNERFYLIDCAEGTQLQLRKYKYKLQRIGNIFISHLHGDHFFGLIGLISTMHLLGRKKELHIYGPAELEKVILLQLEVSQTELIYPFHFHPIDPQKSEMIYENEKLTITTIPLNHRIPTCGFLFREKQGKRRLIKNVINNLDIPVDQFSKIKSGADFIDANGKTYKNSDLTMDPYPIRSYAYCSDTKYHEPIIDIVKKVSLLYHEATFMHDKADVAADKFHSTSSEAATIAKRSEVGKLIIGHFSTRYEDPQDLLQEARQIFNNTDLALDGSTFAVAPEPK
ncbi:MAG: ribonuclease Z [Bacteroidetes bacterium]|nr:ribonuclease Z [Bacteroidota bacterium]